MSKVTITTGQHTVTLEEDDRRAADLAKEALKIWRATKDPNDARKAGVGFNHMGGTK